VRAVPPPVGIHTTLPTGISCQARHTHPFRIRQPHTSPPTAKAGRFFLFTPIGDLPRNTHQPSRQL
jgi:hypothetical protein